MSYYKQTEKDNLDKIEALTSTMPDYMTKYVYSRQNRCTTKTLLAYLSDIKQWMDYFVDYYSLPYKNPNDTPDITQIKAEDFNMCTVDFFDDYFNYLRNYELNGVSYQNSVASIKRKKAAVCSFTTFLFNRDIIVSNVITKVEEPKLRKGENIRLERDEMHDLLNHAEKEKAYSDHKERYHIQNKSRDMAILTLFLSTGIRVSELVGINMDDIDLKHSSIRITRKGDKPDIVYYGEECKNYLGEYLVKREEITPKEGHEEAFFLSMQKKRITVRNVEILIKGYAKEVIPTKHITPHKLRKTYGSMLYEATGDIYLVAQSLGHNSTDTSSRYYIATGDNKKKENRNKITFSEDT